jgi:tryptophan synthase alpha chain
LIPYLTAGYPTRDASLEALHLVADAGADFVEVGIPFSDPLADGPVIQRASHVALERGMSVAGTLQLVSEARLGLPVIAFSYLNPVLAYGLERFCDEARQAGISGLLLTDLPAGEDTAAEVVIRDAELDLIRLVAPTTSGPRLQAALVQASGFIYVIARLGVTGPRTEVGGEVEAVLGRVRAATRLPLAVGFGIASAEQARAVARLADGVVVGTALVQRIADGPEPTRALLEELKAALAPAPGR